MAEETLFTGRAHNLQDAIVAAHREAGGPSGANFVATTVERISYETGGFAGAHDFIVTVRRTS